MGLEEADIDRLDKIIGARRRVARDEALYRTSRASAACWLKAMAAGTEQCSPMT
jgi:hypothetical protein